MEALDAPPVRRVLILHSFGRDFSPFSDVASHFRTELARQSAAPVEFFEASLETARTTEGGAERPFVEYLRALFAERAPHLLVPFGAPAMNFLLRQRDGLFPGVPLLVGTVDKRRLSGVSFGANATAVGVDLDLPEVVENILRTLPGTTDIEVVIGNSPLEKFWLGQMRRDFERFNNRVRFNWLNELSFENIRNRLAALPPNTAVLYAVLLVDAAGVPHEQERALEVLRRESNAPIFGAFDNQLGKGIVGGPLYPVREVSREAGRLAIRILNGEPPGSIQPVLLGSATPVYDWRELKRWGIGEGRLPQGSIVRFRIPSAWEQYHWYIVGGITIIAVQGVLIAGLIVLRARRRQARAFLRQVIDIDPNFIFAKDREGRFTLVNQAVADAYGTTVENLIGKTDADFNSNLEEVEFFRRKDLEVMDKLQERFIPEEHITDAKGKVRWLQTVKRPIIGKDGTANQVLGSATDITERRQAELEMARQRTELAHIARVSTMGELAASMAHELNQPLGAILSNAEAAEMFLNREPPVLGEVREILADIRKDDQRAGEVIQRMRALLGKREMEFRLLEVNEVVRDVLRMVGADAMLRKTAIRSDFAPNPPTIKADRVHLQQVLLNLILNGMEAMATVPEGERQLIVRTGNGDDGTVKIAVSDSGPGVPADKLPKLFEPFFTTKKEGLGMGLAISQRIIEAHGGRIWTENNPEGGATFSFTLAIEKSGK